MQGSLASQAQLFSPIWHTVELHWWSVPAALWLDDNQGEATVLAAAALMLVSLYICTEGMLSLGYCPLMAWLISGAGNNVYLLDLVLPAAG